MSESVGAEWSGPYSPDTIFNRAAAGEFDGVLCMYHDQALIPAKTLSFSETVNVTLGLAFVRRVAEADHEIAPPAGWDLVKSRRYGRTWVTQLERVA